MHRFSVEIYSLTLVAYRGQLGDSPLECGSGREVDKFGKHINLSEPHIYYCIHGLISLSLSLSLALLYPLV